ncbi:MAG: hypothetical protein AAGD96_13575 [Chloroflexota bacterium]
MNQLDILNKSLIGEGEAILPLPADLLAEHANTTFTADQSAALSNLIAIPLNTSPEDAVEAFDQASATFEESAFSLTVETSRAPKFDTFDAYFHINRTHDDPSHAYIYGLLCSFRNVYAMLDPEGTLSVTEIPLLRVALEASLEMFDFKTP